MKNLWRDGFVTAIQWLKSKLKSIKNGINNKNLRPKITTYI
jgi:hypothetical protein